MSQIIKKAPTIKINELKALCKLEKYDKLIEDFKIAVKNDKDKYPFYSTLNIINGKKSCGHKHVKKFISTHKSEIEIIKKHKCKWDLLIEQLKIDTLNLSVITFFKYINEHKDKIDSIEKLIDKMSNLGIEEITLYHGSEFDDEIHKIDTSNYYDLISEKFVYLENIEIIPNYYDNVIKYKTTGSNYYLPLECNFKEKKVKRPYTFAIDVNNLLFDPSLLPSEINYETTIEKIIDLYSKSNVDRNILKDCVDMNVGIEDLIESLENTLKKCELTSDEGSKKQLKDKLIMIKNEIKNLQVIGQNVEGSLINKSDSLTHENIEEEKKLYLKRRYESYFDLD